jgi:Zn-dependent M28 family amino/carboxypeptidase
MLRLLPLLLLTVAAPALAQTAPTPDEAALQAHVAFLADDAMKGREPGTPEYDIAANYVATRMSAAGLVPAGDGGGWFQKVPLVAWKPLTKGSMAFTRAGRRTDLVWGEDFLTRANPLAPDFQVEGDLVFVGYGVVDPASGRDDYKGLDVRGKVVVVLYGGPPGLQSEIRAHYGDRDTKADLAAARGAKAVLFVESTMLRSVYPFATIARNWQQTGMTWADAQGRAHSNGAPTIGYLSQAGAAKVFAGSRIDWARALAADAAGRKVPTGALGARLSSRQDARVWQIASENVVGRLEGADPALKAETIVLSAHLDHVGIGNPVDGDSIYNGAMDNAVGTASMLEVARAFQASGKRPRRTLLFVAVTAEEKGLIGSEYFALNPTPTAGRIVADVNLDMPILTYKFEDLVVYGADRTSIGPVVGEVAKANGLTLTPDPDPDQASFVRSDHYSFVKAGVPAVSLEPGPKGPGKAAIDDFLAHHYHQPSDDLTRPIDWASGVRFVQLNYAITRALADAEARPSWNKGDFFGKLYKGHGAE